jgi:membrane protein
MSSSSFPPSAPVTATLSNSSENGGRVLPSAHPPSTLPPGGGWWDIVKGLVHYLVQSEVHTYAFSVAANAILSIVPFIALMYFLAGHVFHSSFLANDIGALVKFFLPTGGRILTDNMAIWANTHRRHLTIISFVTLFISCTGVFLPLEVALNRVWGVTKNRSYLMNQVISLALALVMVVLAMGTALLRGLQYNILRTVFLHHTDNFLFKGIMQILLAGTTTMAGIFLFFFTYWLLPNRKLPVKAIMRTAMVTGLVWAIAKYLFVASLPYMDLQNNEGTYGPFYISVGLILWGYISGLIILGGAHYSATRYALRMAHEADLEEDLEKQQSRA